MGLPRWVGRAIGLDVSPRLLCGGDLRGRRDASAGRVPSTPDGIGTLAESLLPSDRVGVGGDGELLGGRAGSWSRMWTGWWWSARMTPGSRTRARRPTSSTPARWRTCCGRGELEAVWMPDERCRILRRRLAAASSSSDARTRGEERDPRGVAAAAAGQAAVLGSVRGQGPPMARRPGAAAGGARVRRRGDAPGRVPRRARSPRSERLIAKQALSWPEIRRLMTVPGVNLICAASFIAAVGDPTGSSPAASWSPTWAWTRRSASPAISPARSGRITKRGSASARWALVEAAWSAVLQPGPLHAFYERTKRAARARQGDRRDRPQARGAVLVHAHPRRGLRPPATLADQEEAAPPRDHRRRPEEHAQGAPGSGSTNELMREAERELARQAETSYKRMVKDQRAGAPGEKVGASATPERA